MKLRFYFVALVCLCGGLVFANRLGARFSAQPASQKTASWPLQQTSGDFTLSLNKAAWCYPSSIASGAARFVGEDVAGLGLWFTVKSSRAKSPESGANLVKSVQSVRLFSDDLTDGKSDFELFPKAGAAWNAEVNPRAQSVGVEFEMLDPAAPPNASGAWTSPLNFAGLPLPQGEGKILTLNRSLQTPHGTRVTIEKAVRRAGRLVFVLRLYPPASVPDMQAEFGSDEFHTRPIVPVITDDTGKELSSAALEIESLDGLQTVRPDWEWPFTVKTAAPARNARTFNIALKVEESAPSLKQWQWFHTFRFEVPTAAIASLLPPTKGADVAVVKTPKLQATLESVKPDFGNLKLRFWWRDLQKPKFPDQKWRLSKLYGTGDFTLDTPEEVTPYPIFWHGNGTMPAPDENGEAVIALGGAPRPMTLRAEVEAVRERRCALDFNDLPLPAPAQTIVINREIMAPLGTKITLRQISHVAHSGPMAGFDELELENLRMSHHAGVLVIAFEIQHPQQAQAELNLAWARDEKGHERSQNTGTHKDPQKWLFDFGFPKGAQKLNLHLIAEETRKLGLTETVNFPEFKTPKS